MEKDFLKKLVKNATQKAKGEPFTPSQPDTEPTAHVASTVEPGVPATAPDPTTEPQPLAEPQGAEGPNQQEAPPVDPDKEKKQALKQESEQAHQELVGLLPAAGKMVLQLKTFFEEKRKDLTEEDFEKTFKALFDEYVGIRTRYTNLKKKGDNLYDTYSSTPAKKREKVVADQKEVNEKIRAILTELEGIQGKVVTAEEEAKTKQIIDQLQNTPSAGMPEASVPGAPEAHTAVPSALPADPHLNTPFNRGQRRNRSEAEQRARDRRAAEKHQERREIKEKAERQKREEENRKKELERLQDKKNDLIQESTRVRSRTLDLISSADLPHPEESNLRKQFQMIEDRRMALFDAYDKALKDAQDDEARIAAHGPLLDGLPPITKEFEVLETEVQKVIEKVKLKKEGAEASELIDTLEQKIEELLSVVGKMIDAVIDNAQRISYKERIDDINRAQEAEAEKGEYIEHLSSGEMEERLEEIVKTGKEYAAALDTIKANLEKLKGEVEKTLEEQKKGQDTENEQKKKDAEKEAAIRKQYDLLLGQCDGTIKEIVAVGNPLARDIRKADDQFKATDFELEKIIADYEAVKGRYEQAWNKLKALPSNGGTVEEKHVNEVREVSDELTLISREFGSIRNYMNQWLEKKEREIETLVGEELINDLAYTIREARAEYDEEWDAINDPKDPKKEEEWDEALSRIFKDVVIEEIAEKVSDLDRQEQVFAFIIKKSKT